MLRPATSFGTGPSTSSGFLSLNTPAKSTGFSSGGFGLSTSSAAPTALGGGTSSFSFNSTPGVGANTANSFSLGGNKSTFGAGGGFSQPLAAGQPSTFVQPNTPFGGSTQFGAQSNAALGPQQTRMTSLNQSPYGNSALFAQSPATQQPAQPDISSSPLSSETDKKSSSGIPPHYKATPKSIARVKPRGYGKLQRVHLFDGTTDDAALSPDKFVPRQSVKNLVIKNAPVNERASGLGIGARNSRDTFLATEDDFSVETGDKSSPAGGIRSSLTTTGEKILGEGVNGPQSVISSGNTPNRSVDVLNSSSSANQSMELARPLGRRDVERTRFDSGADSNASGRFSDAGLNNTNSTFPILNRGDYYCKPSLTELKTYSDEQLSKVIDFEVGREAIGSVTFPGVTNVKSLNLDEIVFFEPKEISLYPVESEKPPVGSGLNKKARVCLLNVFPVDKRTRETISDPDELRRRKYDLKVKRMCEKMDAQFVSFDVEDGTWVFEVEHFSKYGLLDDEDDEEDEETQDPKNNAKNMSSRSGASSYNLGSKINEKGKSPMMNESYEDAQPPSQATPFSTEMSALKEDASNLLYVLKDSNSDRRLPETLQLNAEKMQVMRKYLFAAPQQTESTSMEMVDHFEESEIRGSDTGSSAPRGRVHAETKLSSAKTKQTEWVDTSDSSAGHVSKRILLDNAVSEANASMRAPVVSMEKRPQDPVNAETCVMNGKSSLLGDHALFMGRSFRASWGHNGTLITLQKGTDSETPASKISLLNGNSPKSSKYVLNLSAIDVCNEPSGSSLISCLLKAQLETSKILNKESNPVIYLKNRDSAFICLERLMSSVGDAVSRDPESKDLLRSWFYRFKLIKALWESSGQMEGDYDSMEFTGEMPTSSLVEPTYRERLFRRRQFTEWVMDVIADELEEEVDSNCMSEENIHEVFTYLSGNRVVKACEAAKKNRDFRLSLLISQSGSPQVREYLLEQLDKWNSLGASDFVEDSRMKVYQLLCGDVASVSKEVGWVRALGMFLWFDCSPTDGVADAFKRYCNAVKQTFCAKPLPWYLAKESDSTSTLQDMSFHLVSLFCDRTHSLNSLFNPLTWTANELDYSLSWHIFSVLTGIGFQHLPLLKVQQIHMSYMSQLEVLGLWEWAVFIALHIEDNMERETAVRDILSRNISLSTSCSYVEKEEFVLNTLHVNSVWVYLAKAQRAGRDEIWDVQAKYLRKSMEWERCHEVVVKRLAASALIDEKYEVVGELLNELNEHRNEISNWDNDGAVYKDYISICIAFEAFVQKNRMEVSEQYLKSLDEGITSLARRMERLSILSIQHRFCQAEMSTKLVQFSKAIETYLNESFAEFQISNTLRSLPLPDDYMFNQLNVVVDSYVKFVESS